MRGKQIDRLALSAASVLAMLIGASSAAAGPIVDGRFQPGEGYTSGWFVDFAVERVATIVSGGELWLHEDPATGNVTVLFSQPLTLVDNTYGDNAIGWGKGVAPSGKNHNFEDLEDSDRAQFVFTDGLDNVVLDVAVDYISETAVGSGIFLSQGVTGEDGEVNAGLASDVLEWGTSLDYNFNTLGFVLTEDSPATDSDYTENPAYPGWVFEVIYELRVSGSLFSANGFDGVNIPIVHDSPNKIGRIKVFPEPGEVIPEPGMSALLGLGGLLGLIRRRRLPGRSTSA